MMLFYVLACDTVVPQRPGLDVWEACTTDGIEIPLTYAPTAAATVKEDHLGVVHIYAANDADLFFAAGYEQGRQRLYQIDRARHSTRGTLSEMDGESAVETDLIARTFNFLDLGCRTLHFQAKTRPADIGLGVAFTAGLNRYIADLAAGTAEAPDSYGQAGLTYIPEAFTVVDVVAMGKRINLGYSNQIDYDVLVSISQELVNNFDEVPVWAPSRGQFIVDGALETQSSASRSGPIEPLFPPELELDDELGTRLSALAKAHGAGRASNNWAFNGEHTLSGKPVMANDPHASLMTPSMLIAWHLNSAEAGGNFDVAGFSFPGVPGVHLGHNQHVNWTATTNFADVMDIYDVAIDEDGYADMGGDAVKVRTRDEVIRVKQADGSLLEAIYVVTEIPDFGVLLPEELLPVPANVFAEGGVMIAWAGFEPETQELFEYLDFDRSTNIAEFREAVGLEMVGQQNWLFGDATGIGYQTHGHIPVRTGDPRRIQDASDASVLWTGDHLDDALYPTLDGSQDFIGTGNNAPFAHTLDNNPTNDAFYYGSYFDPGWRADRIHELGNALVARGNVSPSDMIEMQADVRSGIASDLLPLLVEVGSRLATDEALADYRDRADLVDAIAVLAAWDGDMDMDSEAAAVFHTWQALLGRRTLFGDMSVLFDAIAEATPVTVAKLNVLAHTQKHEGLLDGRGDIDMLQALSDALEWVEEQRLALGVPVLTWGHVHTAWFKGTFGVDIEAPFSGDESTVNVADCPAWNGNELNSPCASHEGSLYRAIVGFGDDDVPELYFHHGHGGYGPESDWHEFEYKYLPYRKDEVDEATVRTWEIVP